MLRAGVFDDLKGATTLLLWGDAEGMASLLSGFNALLIADEHTFAIDGPTGILTIMTGEGSTLTRQATGLRWHCSRETAELAVGLIEPLLDRAGHKFMNVDELAEQVIISRDEYPVHLG